MITIAMVKQPKVTQQIWSIDSEVFIILYKANKNWPGVKAYRLTGQEKYYEPTWIPESDESEQLGTIQFATDIELVTPNVQHVTEMAEDAVPSTERVEEGSVCSSVQREPLTFIDLKVQQ